MRRLIRLIGRSGLLLLVLTGCSALPASGPLGNLFALLNPRNHPLWVNLLIFVVAAAAIWYAGSRLEEVVDRIAEATGLGSSLGGLILLAIATSLPEIATSITATLAGNVSLAVHNLIGSSFIQLGLLAVADFVEGRGSITHFTPRYVLLIQSGGVVLLLACAVVIMALGDIVTLPIALAGQTVEINPALVVLPLAYFAMTYLTHISRGDPRWQPTGEDTQPEEAEASAQHDADEHDAEGTDETPLTRRWLIFAGFAAVVLVAGVIVARTADVLAVQTGLGASFVGFTLLALATAMPEMSTTFTAARRRHYNLAFSNIFGSVAFNVMLLFLVAALYPGDPIFSEPPPSVTFAAALGIVLTCVYLWGLLTWRNRVFLRLGWDSWVVLVLVAAGIGGVYLLR